MEITLVISTTEFEIIQWQWLIVSGFCDIVCDVCSLKPNKIRVDSNL